jgi:hypothetical protein
MPLGRVPHAIAEGQCAFELVQLVPRAHNGAQGSSPAGFNPAPVPVVKQVHIRPLRQGRAGREHWHISGERGSCARQLHNGTAGPGYSAQREVVALVPAAWRGHHGSASDGRAGACSSTKGQQPPRRRACRPSRVCMLVGLGCGQCHALSLSLQALTPKPSAGSGPCRTGRLLRRLPLLWPTSRPQLQQRRAMCLWSWEVGTPLFWARGAES